VLSPLAIDGLAALAAIAMERCQAYEKEERAETAVEREHLRGAVLDALAHEIKTPLTAVQTASAGLMELGGLTAPQSELASLIDDGAARLNELCTRLLKAARLEPKPAALKTADVMIGDVFSEVMRDAANENGDPRIQIAPEAGALSVCADRGLLAMILAQFIDNARKYSTPGTPIGIAAREGRAETLISVHNFGPVIPIEDRERIFERFYRSPSLKDSIAGTGIGLSVVRKAAEAHRGHVWVISDEREGTTFFLSLPNGPDQSKPGRKP
jgi:two-component system sensor histidine kinase KdpD